MASEMKLRHSHKVGLSLFFKAGLAGLILGAVVLAAMEGLFNKETYEGIVVLVLPGSNTDCKSSPPGTGREQYCVISTGCMANGTAGSPCSTLGRFVPTTSGVCRSGHKDQRIWALTGMRRRRIINYNLDCLNASACEALLDSGSACDQIWADRSFREQLQQNSAASQTSLSGVYRIAPGPANDFDLWGRMCGFCSFRVEFVTAIAFIIGSCVLTYMCDVFMYLRDRWVHGDDNVNCLFMRQILEAQNLGQTSAIWRAIYSVDRHMILSYLQMYPWRLLSEMWFAVNMALFFNAVYDEYDYVSVMLSALCAVLSAFEGLLYILAFQVSKDFVTLLAETRFSNLLFYLSIVSVILSSVALVFQFKALESLASPHAAFIAPAIKVLMTLLDIQGLVARRPFCNDSRVPLIVCGSHGDAYAPKSSLKEQLMADS
jgi:hypothetical protein